MASINDNGSRGHHKFTLNVNETGVSTANNTSTISYSFVLSPVQTGWDWNISGVSYSFTINGVKTSGTIRSYNGSSTITLKSGTQTIPHNSDGSKTISFSFSVTDSAGKTYTPGNASASGSLTLTKIARQATITSAPNFNDEQNPTITYSNPLGTSVNVLQACISLNGTAADISYRDIPKTGTSYTFELTQAERETLLNAATNSNSLSVRFYVRTQIGSTYYYNYLTRTMTIINANPIFNDFEYRDSNSTTAAITGDDQILIKGQSQLELTISSSNKMVAIKEATPKNYGITFDTINTTTNYSSTGNVLNLGSMQNAGQKRLSVRAYDSRNNSAEAYKDVTILDYSLPVLNTTATRTNNFEAQTTITAFGSFNSLLVNDIEKNSITSVQYRYRETGATWGNWQNMTFSIDGNEYSCADTILNLDNTKAFEIEVKVQDAIGETVNNMLVAVGKPIFFISDNERKCYINDIEVETVKSIITVKLNNNTSYSITTAWGSKKILLDTQYAKKGTNLTFENNQIKINKEGYYKISGNLMANSSNATYIRNLQIHQNSDIIGAGYINGSTAYMALSVSPMLIYAQENDIISMFFTSNNTGSFTVAGSYYTYLTVEEV